MGDNLTQTDFEAILQRKGGALSNNLTQTEYNELKAEYSKICQRLSGRGEDIRDFISSLDEHIARKNNAKEISKEILSRRGGKYHAQIIRTNDFYDKEIEGLYRKSIYALLEYEARLDMAND